MSANDLRPLIGIPIVAAGFMLRLNALLVVVASGLVTGLAAGIAPLDLLDLDGEKFESARSLLFFVLMLPVIGLMERNGLREQSARLAARLRGMSAGRILQCYFIIRQIAAALGLPFGGQVSMIRPLLVPMLEGAAANRLDTLPEAVPARLRAHAAAAENIALIFGENVFFAEGNPCPRSSASIISALLNTHPETSTAPSKSPASRWTG